MFVKSRAKIVVVVSVLLMSVFVWVQTGPSSFESGTVDWVIDGDTIVVDGSSIRLLDIDAAELGEPLGDELLWVMVDLVHGEIVELECDGYDRYGRRLCLVYVSGVSVSDVMLGFDGVRKWR